jgi:uncharacterized protein (DUF1499 family)
LNEAKARVKLVLCEFPRTELIKDEEDYLQVRSFLFGFVAEIDLVLDETTKTIHFRSTAHNGYYDFEVNRKRTERVRQRLEVVGSRES